MAWGGKGKHVAVIPTIATLHAEGHHKRCDLNDCSRGFKDRDPKVAWKYPKHKKEN